MRFRVLAAAFALLFAAPAPVLADGGWRVAALAPAPAAPRLTAADLMVRYGLDTLFAQFGRTIASSPRIGGITDERFLKAWEAEAVETFAVGRLNAALAERLTGGLETGDLDVLQAFIGSDLGVLIGKLEHETQTVPAERQIAVVAKGQTIYLETPPGRRAQFEELLKLTGADMLMAIVRESIRGMALGLHLSDDRGDLRQDWATVDAELEAQLAGMRESLDEATRAVLAYTYASLSDAEIEAYLTFLRSPATRKFYAIATTAIGDILQETMLSLGRGVARRLSAVQI